MQVNTYTLRRIRGANYDTVLRGIVSAACHQYAVSMGLRPRLGVSSPLELTLVYLGKKLLLDNVELLGDRCLPSPNVGQVDIVVLGQFHLYEEGCGFVLITFLARGWVTGSLDRPYSTITRETKYYTVEQPEPSQNAGRFAPPSVQ